MADTVNDEVNKKLELGVIEHSDSSNSSPIVLVTKKDNTYRFCVDFRALNRITVFDADPMPDVDAMFAKLSGDSQSTIDLFCSSFDRYISSFRSFSVHQNAFLGWPQHQQLFVVLCVRCCKMFPIS